MNKMRLGILLFWMLLLAIACRKQPDPVAAPQLIDHGGIEPPGFRVQFTPTVNGAPLVLGAAWYRNAAGDSFRVSDHKYYVSNFMLETDSGVAVKLPETYLLVDAANVQPREIKNIPPGTYRKISFLLGVDSARNVSGAQTGDLDPLKGMFWDWDAGYIMAKTEGFSPQSNRLDSTLFFHIVGFSGKTSVLRTVKLDLPTPLVIKAGAKPIIQVQSDLASWFSGPSPFSFSECSSVTAPGAQAVAIANNYSKGFRVVRVSP